MRGEDDFWWQVGMYFKRDSRNPFKEAAPVSIWRRQEKHQETSSGITSSPVDKFE
jgi:hypothetical protein